MKDKVTAVITSFNRIELLKQTVDTLQAYFDGEIIIIEDSVNKEMHEKVKELYPQHTLVFNEENIGLIKSIDKAYALVKTPFVFHSEDDFLFHKGGFIEKSVKILESDDKIVQVWCRGTDYYGRNGHPLSQESYMADDVLYHFVLPKNDWHGFSFYGGLQSMKAYHEIAPYDDLISEWKDENGDIQGGTHITNREKACEKAYYEAGYRAAILTEKYAEHVGYGFSTYGLKNR